MSEERAETGLAVREPLDIFQHFDSLDDAAIVDELEGRLVEAAVYHFPQEGKELWGLAKVGVDWCVTELGKKGIAFRDEELKYELDPTDSSYVLFTARVGKHLIDKTGAEARVEAAIGSKRQWTKLKRRDGTIVTDPFWFEKGGQKAIRNARMRLIPEETKAAIITAAKAGGRVKDVKEAEIGGQGRGMAASPAPAPSLSRFYLLKEIGEEKSRVGNDAYYALLKNSNFEHADQVPPERRPKLLDLLRNMDDYPEDDGDGLPEDEGDGL